MNKNILIGIVVLIIVFLGAWWWMSQSGAPAYAPTTGQEAPGAVAPALEPDNTARIEQDVNSVDPGNLDTEFQSIDQDLGTL